MICAYCKATFTPQRRSARYCSTKCRVAAKRVSVTGDDGLSVTKSPVSVTDDSVTELSVTDQAVSVTKAPDMAEINAWADSHGVLPGQDYRIWLYDRCDFGKQKPTLIGVGYPPPEKPFTPGKRAVHIPLDFTAADIGIARDYTRQ